MFEKTFPGPFFNSTPLVITIRSFPELGFTSGSFFCAGTAILAGVTLVKTGCEIGFGERGSSWCDGLGADGVDILGDEAPESIATLGAFGCLTGTVDETTGLCMMGADVTGENLGVGIEATSTPIFFENLIKIGLETKWSVGETIALTR